MNSVNNTPILEARHVSKSFGKFKALQNVSTSFMPGTLTAIIGPNGAGKSTTFSILTMESSRSDGLACVLGQDVIDLDP
jgi:branched-chain amino acid transport system ATP-binding protein